MPVRCLPAFVASLLALSVARAQELQTFQNYNHTFQLELPKGWRLIAPNEAVTLSENEAANRDLHLSQPRRFYAVGPVDRWLTGELSGGWLYVVEQREAWHFEDDYPDVLREAWRTLGEGRGEQHELADIHLEEVGTQKIESVVATRTTTDKSGRKWRYLEVHTPTAGQQLTFSFGAELAAFDDLLPEFRSWLETLTVARIPQEKAKLSDRLWTPMLTGGAVGLVLLVLYRRTRGRR